MGTASESARTRQNLIEAAGPLFADRGFDGVSVRDIVAATKTHLSAVNYHFRDKAGLYRACIESAFDLPRFDAIKSAEIERQSPNKMLRRVVASLVEDFGRTGVDSWRGRLYLRLLVDGGEPFDWFETLAKPKYMTIRAVVAGAATRDLDAARIDIATFSLIGILDQVANAGGYLPRIAPALTRAMKRKDWLIEAIVESTLSILNGKRHVSS